MWGQCREFTLLFNAGGRPPSACARVTGFAWQVARPDDDDEVGTIDASSDARCPMGSCGMVSRTASILWDNFMMVDGLINNRVTQNAVDFFDGGCLSDGATKHYVQTRWSDISVVFVYQIFQ